MTQPEALDRLAGKHIFLAEDEYMIADDMRRLLERSGAHVIGPVATVTQALQLLDATDEVDLAVLDLNLGGEKAFVIADRLRDRGVRFVFATGYDQSATPPRFSDVPHYEKPLDVRLFLQALDSGP
ncbi:response regulator [Brevundimonas sp. PAMC22021]|uniref:response regulator n=1 Tax=Brevundimonas sp. PAMC22021 TaxID=2861285 RepID=UPI001C629B86|nr:response regulator [Brevundimonas sp. PAMC22021]QYF86849.1 response regulator [Brevundimonas sp. PAMC22021]